MCGIAGFVDFGASGSALTLGQMAATLAHRGPDDVGECVVQIGKAQVGLAHRRLSVIDLRPEAAQPMRYEHLHVVYNGEIYNYREIRATLEHMGHTFATSSDTEVLLHAFAEWGIQCVRRCIGMFAFAILDTREGRLYLCRDRVGVKPLFVYRDAQVMLFASELKALHKHPRFRAGIDAAAVAAYFDYGYVPSGRCIYEHTQKLAPATWQSIDLDTGNVETCRYWSITDSYHEGPLQLSYEEASDRLGELLVSACSYRMVADVPVGLFLSGGYDSTAVLATLRRAGHTRIQTFTIGFETGNNELPQARQIARALECEHDGFMCTEAEARQIVPVLPDIYDEPFADSSAIPSILVARMAAKQVTVALSADGGDEVFFGYQAYVNLVRRMAVLGRLSAAQRRTLSHIVTCVSEMWQGGSKRWRHAMYGLGRALAADEKSVAGTLHWWSLRLPGDYHEAILHNGKWKEEHPRLLAADVQSVLDAAACWDFEQYLVDDILVKVDRATMAASIEGREPLLDHRLAEFGARLPFEHKYVVGSPKRILRDYVHRHVPAQLMAGPKRGFSVPVLKWLREDLSDLLDEHLSSASVARSGLLDPTAVEDVVRRFRDGRLHYDTLVWKLLMFQMWYARWADGK